MIQYLKITIIYSVSYNMSVVFAGECRIPWELTVNHIKLQALLLLRIWDWHVDGSNRWNVFLWKPARQSGGNWIGSKVWGSMADKRPVTANKGKDRYCHAAIWPKRVTVLVITAPAGWNCPAFHLCRNLVENSSISRKKYISFAPDCTCTNSWLPHPRKL